MELIEQQRLLARLYTDAETRRLWLAEPEKFVEAFGVDGGTAEKLSTQVEFFARSLQRKRLKAVTTQFPATHQAMGRRFDELFFEYSRKPSPSGEDAVGFARFLRESQPPIPRSQLALARFEAGMLEARQRSFIVRWFRATVHRMRCLVT
jgi:hypothetical protein